MVGDVVWAPVFYTDLSGFKPRPVVLLVDGGMRDWIVCPITSGQLFRPGDVALARNDLERGQLPAVSRVRVDRLTTLNEIKFGRPIGRLTDAKTAEILAVVRWLF